MAEGKGQGTEGSRESLSVDSRGAHADLDIIAGTFLVDLVNALVLFNSGASRYFVSYSFSHSFSILCEALSIPLRVWIANEHPVSATDVYRGCLLEIFSVGYPIDLIPIPMRDVCVIVGIDWLSRFGDLVDYDCHLVTVRDPSRGVLTIYGRGNRLASTFCSATFVVWCTGFQAYIVDTRVVKKGSTFVSDVMMICDFPDFFPEELSGLPPERQLEYKIDLIPSAVPIAMAPYLLAPTEMQELSSQL